MKNVLKFFSLASFFTVIIFCFQCTREEPFRYEEERYLNLEDSVAYTGMNICASCHPENHKTYMQTGMGRSFEDASPQKSAATYGEHALVYNKEKDLYYKPFFQGDEMFVLEYRLEEGDTVHQRLEQIDYIIGSGQHTNSHIIDINGYIYQAPVTFYTQDGKWDMAPGFQGGGNERFDRFLTLECISCHNNLPQRAEGSINKFTKMPQGIECERCHGPGEVHWKMIGENKLVDTSLYVDYSIVTPTDLDRELQMDLCMRCHLQGVAVLHEGKSFFDFKPGMALNEVMNVFLPRYTDSREKFIMASQADRLKLSKCYKQSQMTCLDCHDAHQSVRKTDWLEFVNICKSCHDGSPEKLRCTEIPDKRNAEGDDCIICHMKSSGSIDIPHVSITDHFIRRRFEETKIKEEGRFEGLQILTKDQGSPLEMAKGYIALYEKYIQSEVMLDSAKYYLDRSALSVSAKFNTLVHYFFAREEHEGTLRLSSFKTSEEIEDAWTLYRIGEAYFSKGQFQDALVYFQKATRLMPLVLSFQEKLGTAHLQLRQLDKAKEVFLFILSENPKQKIALSNLGFAHALSGEFQKAESYYDRAIAQDPDYEQALLNKAAIRNLNGDLKSTKRLLKRVLKINPENAQALSVLAGLPEE